MSTGYLWVAHGARNDHRHGPLRPRALPAHREARRDTGPALRRGLGGQNGPVPRRDRPLRRRRHRGSGRSNARAQSPGDLRGLGRLRRAPHAVASRADPGPGWTRSTGAMRTRQVIEAVARPGEALPTMRVLRVGMDDLTAPYIVNRAREVTP